MQISMPPASPPEKHRKSKQVFISIKNTKKRHQWTWNWSKSDEGKCNFFSVRQLCWHFARHVCLAAAWPSLIQCSITAMNYKMVPWRHGSLQWLHKWHHLPCRGRKSNEPGEDKSAASALATLHRDYSVWGTESQHKSLFCSRKYYVLKSVHERMCKWPLEGLAWNWPQSMMRNTDESRGEEGAWREGVDIN